MINIFGYLSLKCYWAGAAKFIAMATEEKRKLYKCGRQFFTIEGIPSVDNLALKG